MRWPLVFTSRYEALDAQYQRVLAERDAALADRDTERGAKQITARQNVLLSGRVEERDARIRDLSARLARFVDGPTAAAHADDVAGLDLLDRGESAYKDWLKGGRP